MNASASRPRRVAGRPEAAAPEPGAADTPFGSASAEARRLVATSASTDRSAWQYPLMQEQGARGRAGGIR
jgi:hypothetical protein